MLGLNENGNNILYIVGNFLLFFGAQIAIELAILLPQETFPSPFQVYASAIKSLVATFGIWGINKATNKETKK